MKYVVLLCFFSILSCRIGVSQTKTFVIVDSISKTTVPYVNVLLTNSYLGWSANDKGEIAINLSKVTLSDVIELRAIGYQRKSFLFSEIYKEDTLFLLESSTELKEVKIRAKRLKKARLGRKKASKSWGGSGLGKYGEKAGKSKYFKEAKFIPNDIGANGIIDEIRVFVRFGSEYPFEIDILDTDKLTGEPTESLLKQPLEVIGRKDKRWLTVDVKKRNIHIPETGFFVSVNFIVDSANFPPLDYSTYKVYYQEEEVSKIDTFFYRGTVVANNYEKEANWWINNDTVWSNYWQKTIDYRDTCVKCLVNNPAMNNYNFRTSNKTTLAVYANILYSKSVKKYEENILDKEGIVTEKDQVKTLSMNHLFVEENKLVYPQKDVFELFASKVRTTNCPLISGLYV